MNNKWPFYPDQLTDIMEPEMASLLQSGCAEKLTAPLLIVELQDGEPYYIPPINRYQHFQPLCHVFRNEDIYHIVGGDDACKAFEADKAREILLNNKITQRRKTIEEEETLIDQLSEAYACHLGFVDIVAPIVVAGKPIAVLLTGQRKPSPRKEGRIIEKINQIGTPESEYSADVQITNEARDNLKEMVPVFDFLERHNQKFLDELKVEAKLISSFARKEYDSRRTERQSEFTRQLLNLYYSTTVSQPHTVEDVSRSVDIVLDEVRKFCGATYVALFSWTNEDSGNILDLVGGSGIPQTLRNNTPYFHWQNAGFPLQGGIGKSDEQILDLLPALVRRGVIIKDEVLRSNAVFFYNASCVLPIVLADTYRAVILFGPFESDREVIVKNELAFLRLLADSIGHRFLMRFISVESEQKNNTWGDIADLITHEVGNRSQPIKTKLDIIGYYLNEDVDYSLEEAKKARDIAENMVVNLSRYASATFHVYQSRVIEEQMKVQLCALLEIINELIDEFRDYAKQKRISFVIGDDVSEFPQVEIHKEGIRIALRSIINNAIKYSHKDSRYIGIYGKSDTNNVEISIEDFGLGLPEDPAQKERLFKKGVQSEIRGKSADEPGEGIGLWKALKHVEAHGGEILAESSRVDKKNSKPGEGYRTVFTIKLPIHQAPIGRM